MQFNYLASVALMAYSIQAQAPPAPAPAPPAPTPAPNTPAPAPPTASPPPTSGKQPNIIPMNCAGAYMPFSEADVAALSSNQTQLGSAGNYSTIPTEAACKGLAGSSVDGLCDLSSCSSHPVCNTCVEVIITGNTTTTGSTTVSQVTCTNNYLFESDNDKSKNYCTDSNDKTYICSGACQGFTSCQLCVSIHDPALKTFQGP